MKKRLIASLVLLICLTGCTSEEKKTEKVQEDNISSESSCQTDMAQSMNNEEQTETVTELKPNYDIEDDKVVITLLDTGVSTTAITSDHLLKGYNYVTNSSDTEDVINHGTAVASAILGCESAGVDGIAKEAYIVPLVVVTRMEGKTVSVSPEILAQAIQDSVDMYGADIINVSLGIQKNDETLLQAVAYAEQKEVLIVSAVGNGGTEGKPYYPASYDSVLAVGSCDEDGQESEFSQKGSDVLALGEDIWLASKNGMTYGARGTSYATGFVSAVAANLLLTEPGLSSQRLREKIIENANEYGCGLP